MANQIVRDINKITYSENDAPLSKEDICKLLEYLKSQLSTNVVWFLKEGENRKHLELVSYIANLLAKK